MQATTKIKEPNFLKVFISQLRSMNWRELCSGYGLLFVDKLLLLMLRWLLVLVEDRSKMYGVVPVPIIIMVDSIERTIVGGAK